MKRGPKAGRARRVIPPSSAPTGLGDCPPELVGLGRDLWLDAVAYLDAEGRSFRVHRTALRIACRLVDTLETDAGLNRIDACRRWLHELGLTNSTAGKGAHEDGTQQQQENGRAKLLRLIAGKKASA